MADNNELRAQVLRDVAEAASNSGIFILAAFGHQCAAKADEIAGAGAVCTHPRCECEPAVEGQAWSCQAGSAAQAAGGEAGEARYTSATQPCKSAPASAPPAEIKSATPRPETPLSPCPFCGGRAYDNGGHDEAWRVACESCGASVYGITKTETFAAWNRRTSSAPAGADASCPECHKYLGHCPACHRDLPAPRAAGADEVEAVARAIAGELVSVLRGFEMSGTRSDPNSVAPIGFGDDYEITVEELQEIARAAISAMRPAASQRNAGAAEEVAALADRYVHRENTDFLGRMAQSLCEAEGLCGEDQLLPEDSSEARAEYRELMMDLAALALAQAMMVDRHD